MPPACTYTHTSSLLVCITIRRALSHVNQLSASLRTSGTRSREGTAATHQLLTLLSWKIPADAKSPDAKVPMNFLSPGHLDTASDLRHMIQCRCQKGARKRWRRALEAATKIRKRAAGTSAAWRGLDTTTLDARQVPQVTTSAPLVGLDVAKSVVFLAVVFNLASPKSNRFSTASPPHQPHQYPIVCRAGMRSIRRSRLPPIVQA